MKRICIFAGSSDEAIPFFKDDVERLAVLLAENKFSIVYGAGKVGLMGVLARKYRECGGTLVGVVPHYLNCSSLVYEHCDELIVTKDFHDRKETMENLSDAFIVLPGGMGTMDELLNVLAPKQLKYHQKPVFLLNTDNFFDFMNYMLEKMLRYCFIHSGHKHLYQCVDTPEELIGELGKSLSLSLRVVDE